LALALSKYSLTAQESELHDHLTYEESKQKISDEGGGLVKGKKGKKPKRGSIALKKKGLQTKSLSPRTISFDPNAPVNAAVLAKWHSVVIVSDEVKFLPGNNTLTTLILDDNLVTGIGLATLADMLKVNQKIVNFSIEGNPDLRPADVHALARQYVPPPPSPVA
jgi:hypothetical protein